MCALLVSAMQSRCAIAARAAEAAAAEREQLERKVARLEKAKETEHKGARQILHAYHAKPAHSQNMFNLFTSPHPLYFHSDAAAARPVVALSCTLHHAACMLWEGGSCSTCAS